MSLLPSPFSPAPEFISSRVTTAHRFYLNLRPRTSARIAVVCGGREECAADYAIERKTFPFWSIEFVGAGTGELTLEGKHYTLCPGSVFAYGPRVPHMICTTRGEPLTKYFVDFLGDPSLQLLRACGLKPGRLAQVLAVGDVREAFDALIRLGSQHDLRTERTCALQLQLLLHTIARSQQVCTVSDRRSRATFERVRQFMDTHCLEVSSVEKIATACHLDSSHLSRLVRRFHNESPLRYLQRRRMQWAADRLLSSPLFIREVAEELQMDAFQFSRTFKRIHGLSPTEFLATRAHGMPRIVMPDPGGCAGPASPARNLLLLPSVDRGVRIGKSGRRRHRSKLRGSRRNWLKPSCFRHEPPWRRGRPSGIFAGLPARHRPRQMKSPENQARLSRDSGGLRRGVRIRLLDAALQTLAFACILPSAGLAQPLFEPGARVLFQGDSITDMGRGRTEDPNHILGHSYVFIIAARQGAAFPVQGVTFINRGVSGNTLADLAARWQADTIALKPDVLSILIGINDVGHCLKRNQPVSIDSYERAYDRLLGGHNCCIAKGETCPVRAVSGTGQKHRGPPWRLGGRRRRDGRRRREARRQVSRSGRSF